MKDAINLLLHLFPIGEESIQFFAVKYNTKKETSTLICTVMKSCVGHKGIIHCSGVRERGEDGGASSRPLFPLLLQPPLSVLPLQWNRPAACDEALLRRSPPLLGLLAPRIHQLPPQ